MKIVNLCVMDPSEERILLINRENEPYRGYWGMPGGKIKNGELPRIAAERELFEETQISQKIDCPLGFCIERIFENSGNLKYFFEIYFFKVISEMRKIKQCEEGVFDWFSVLNLQSYHVIPSDIENCVTWATCFSQFSICLIARTCNIINAVRHIRMIEAFCKERISCAGSEVIKSGEDYLQKDFFEIIGK